LNWQARHRYNLVDESIDREIELAVEQMKLAHERYLNSLLQFRISTENYQLARAQHRSGVLSSNRLLEVEAALSAAQSAMVVAKVEFYIAQSIYYQSIVSAETSGRVVQHHFSEGTTVSVGDTLLVIDPSRLELELASARAGLTVLDAQLSTARTQVRQAAAAENFARSEFERADRLLRSGTGTEPGHHRP